MDDAIKEAKNHARKKMQSRVNSYIITNFLMKQYELFFEKNYRNQIDWQIFETELKEDLVCLEDNEELLKEVVEDLYQ